MKETLKEIIYRSLYKCNNCYGYGEQTEGGNACLPCDGKGYSGYLMDITSVTLSEVIEVLVSKNYSLVINQEKGIRIYDTKNNCVGFLPTGIDPDDWVDQTNKDLISILLCQN